jgi:hypothetical protein
MQDNNRKVHIETQDYNLAGTWFCLSPKNKLPTKTVYDKAHELKVIILTSMILFLQKSKQSW